MKINRHILENGLRLVHSQDESTQMVALNVLYNVGARDEHPEHTGFAHLFEHLMFGGSVNIPDYDMPLQLAGGENNAWTNNDITNYYLTVPRQNVETGFWLESDRMLSLDFSERSLEVQRGVVMEEFKQRCLNQPYGDVGHLLRPLAYRAHTYQWPTIGKDLSHIANATLEEVKAFFFRFYAPNNAVLAVTGNISFEEAVALTEKWFGPIPRREVPQRNLPQEPEQTEERRLTVERNVPLDSLFMAYHMCSHDHPDYYAFDILSDLLSNGRSSRLNQRLVQQKQLFSSIDAYISGSVDAGLFHISGKPAAGVSLEQAEAAVREELERLQQEPVDEQELEKVKKQEENSIRTKSFFLSNMSHEIRTPLNALSGFSSILTEESIDNETRKQCSDIIQQNSELLLKLINDVIDLSSLEVGKMKFKYERCDAVAICRNVIDMVEKIKQTNANVRFSTSLHSLELTTDNARLQQLLINLLINATKFTPQGSITMELEKQTEDIALFSVTDTGCGISPENQNKIFNRFEKLNENAQGTGLGLSICQLIIEQLGGKIWIDSNYEEGARFLFTHPIYHEQQGKEEAE